MLRVIVGLVKGLIVGGGVGYGLLRLGWDASASGRTSRARSSARWSASSRGRAPWKARPSGRRW